MDSTTLVVCDFDWSLVDANCDMFVFEKLGSERFNSHVQKRASHKTLWIELMDELLVQLQTKENVTSDQMRQCLATVPLHPDMKTALEKANNMGAKLILLSNGNDFFIRSVLQAHNCEHLFSSIITNPTHVDARGLLRLGRRIPVNARPHACSRCPVNMCKGYELQQYLNHNGNNFKKVIYLGDSKNDICPTLSLSLSDVILARRDYGLHLFWQERFFSKSTSTLLPQLLVWANGSDVLRHFRDLLTVSSIDGAEEFQIYSGPQISSRASTPRHSVTPTPPTPVIPETSSTPQAARASSLADLVAAARSRANATEQRQPAPATSSSQASPLPIISGSSQQQQQAPLIQIQLPPVPQALLSHRGTTPRHNLPPAPEAHQLHVATRVSIAAARAASVVSTSTPPQMLLLVPQIPPPIQPQPTQSNSGSSQLLPLQPLRSGVTLVESSPVVESTFSGELVAALAARRMVME